MAKKALFAGLVFDENDRPLETDFVGQESCYVIDDHGFKRYVPSEEIDRQIWKVFADGISGNEDILSTKTAEMIGKDDLITVAMLKTAMKDFSGQIDLLLETGLPQDAVNMMGLLGYKFTVNFRGELFNVDLPAGSGEEE